ncbi:MAG: translocation/assembly module TamB domain-containing protein, partial [Myxococcota bacterium]
AWSIRVAGEQLNAMRTVNVQWANETLVIPEAAFAGPDIRLLVAGKVPLRSPMRLRVFGDGSLNALALMSNRVKRGRGNTKFSLDIGGLLERPTFDGELSIENGALTLSGARQQADAINARLTFSGAAANIDYARFDYGGGKVRLGGQFVFSPELGTEVSVRSEFERVSVNPAAGTTATLSGNLLLLGPLDDLRLRGDVNVDRARYTRNVDLAAIIPRRRSSPLQVPAIESTEVIDLAVKVKANNGIFISNNVLDAEFRADLTVTGTTNRVGLLGTVTPIEAKARYAGNLYELERGSVDFTEEYEIFSRFSVSARTEACGLDIKVDVFGDSETYNLSPSGSDENGPVDPQDVLLCLQFGSRVRDFTTGGAPVSSATVGGVNDEMAAAAGLDALWTVSGLDERVREVLPIDELRITNAWSPQAGGIRPRLVIGKDIGEAVRLQYWQSISFGGDQSAEEAYQAFSIQYALSKNATLEGNWLSEYQQDVPVTDLGLDLRLRWELR